MAVLRRVAGVLAGVLVLAVAGCPDSSSGASDSCASVVDLDGVRYIGGRGEALTPVSRTGTELTAATAFCEDGDVQPRPQRVQTIPGVDVHDAVVRTDAWQRVLADRLWSVPRDQLPASVRPYVGR